MAVVALCLLKPAQPPGLADGAEFILREVISRSKKSALPQQPKPGPQASPFSRLQSGCCPTMLIHTGRGPRRCHYHASA